METSERPSEDVLRMVAIRLGPSLAQGRLLMSELDACLADLGVGTAAKERAIEALDDAGIKVVSDRPADVQGDPTRRSCRSAELVAQPQDQPAGDAMNGRHDLLRGTPRDPLEVGRNRLAIDARLRPGQLSKRLLTADEEIGLTLLARPDGRPLESGGFGRLTGEARQAANAMMLHNMGLVHSIAQRHGGMGLEYEDLVASGVIGLLRAVEMFDPFHGHKFSTYSTHWIRQSISRSIDDTARAIRIPVHMCETVRRVSAAQRRLTADGRKPRWDELSRECGLSVEKVQEALRVAPAVVSLDTPVGNDGVTLGDLIDAPIRSEEHVELHGIFPEDLDPLLLQVDHREADVLRRRHGMAPYDEKQTLEEIGVVYGVTRERIRQIETKGLTKLRDAVGFSGSTNTRARKVKKTRQG